ncbi:hypothetical protein C8Q70DRAFT_690236 [Cubamyces menziesii]|nr:hypothetical protein C8Q70DRAFT_690236 [Cubamyces menziesii]
MARSTVLTTKTINARKRKSTGGIDDSKGVDASNKRRRTIDTFFSPQVTIVTNQGDDAIPTCEHVSLNSEQVRVLQMVVQEEKNVFFTGAAGTGKSLLLRAIIQALRRKYAKKPEVVSVTASTGMAASNIGGMTIHSWGAVTPGMHNIDRQISCIKTLSMVDGQLFDTLAKLAVQLPPASHEIW